MTQTQKTVREVKEMTCWFLLLDIQKFVELCTRMSADELAQMVGAWLAECQRIIENHGGILSKFLGDGLLVYWNTRFCDSTSVAEALKALRCLQARRQPAFRWALHFGKAVFGAAAAPGELSALGQDLNFLFRIERLAAANQFGSIISETAQAKIGSLLGTQPLGLFPLKGLGGEYALFGCSDR